MAMTNIKKKNMQGVLFVMPALLVVVLLTFYPIYETFQLSFSKVNLQNFNKVFTGLENYEQILAKEFFWKAAWNMVAWVFSSVVLNILLGYLAALAINQLKRGEKIFRVIVFLPWTLCLVSVTLAWKWLLHSDYGLLNNFLETIGLAAWRHNWLSDSSIALFSVVVVSTWYRYPFVMLMVLAGLQTVPEDMLSAASIDGANRFQVFRFITLPWLRNLNGLLLVMSVIYAMQVFTPTWLMTGGGPAHSTELFSTLIYRLSFRNMDFPAASTIGALLFVLSTLVIVPYVYLVSKRKVSEV